MISSRLRESPIQLGQNSCVNQNCYKGAFTISDSNPSSNPTQQNIKVHMSRIDQFDFSKEKKNDRRIF